MRYEFIVEQAMQDEMASEVPELSTAPFPSGGTSLFGPVRDEADVQTLFARLRHLGLSVVQIRRLPD